MGARGSRGADARGAGAGGGGAGGTGVPQRPRGLAAGAGAALDVLPEGAAAVRRPRGRHLLLRCPGGRDPRPRPARAPGRPRPLRHPAQQARPRGRGDTGDVSVGPGWPRGCGAAGTEGRGERRGGTWAGT